MTANNISQHQRPRHHCRDRGRRQHDACRTTGTVSSVGDGIHTEADVGPTLITAGPITSAVGDGIDATAFDNGNITVHANGAITANGTGIQTDSDGGDITVTTAAAAKISAWGPGGHFRHHQW